MSSLKYRPDIDGLRAVAVLLVVFFHAFPGALPSGFIGVDIFFVISGFLITRVILNHLEKSNFSFLDFYANRMRRLLPALIFMLVIVWFIARYFLLVTRFESLGRDFTAGAFFLSNFLFWKQSGYFDFPLYEKPLLHLWSLAVEEQFYLIWPVLIWCGFKRNWNLKALTVVLISVSFATNIYQMYYYPIADFYLLPSRFWELGIGCLLAQIKCRTQSNFILEPLPIILLMIAIIFIGSKSPYPGWAALLPTFACFIYIMNGPNGWFNRFLSHKKFVFIGLISYPLYLWHWPILSIAYLYRFKTPSISVRYLLILFSMLMAFLTWKYIEKPFKKFALQKRISLTFKTGISALVLLGILGLFASNKILYPRLSAPQQLLANYMHYKGSWGESECFLGDPSADYKKFKKMCTAHSEKNIFIWGDSYSAALASGLHAFFGARHISVSQLGASLCPPVLNFEERTRKHCVSINNYIFQKIIETQPKMVVLSANWLQYHNEENFFYQFNQTIDALHRVGIKEVIVLGQTPIWNYPLYEVLIKNKLIPIPKYTMADLSEKIFEMDSLVQSSLSTKNYTYLKILPTLCKPEGCLTLTGDHLQTDLVVSDSGHPTNNTSNYIANIVVGPVLLKKML